MKVLIIVTIAGGFLIVVLHSYLFLEEIITKPVHREIIETISSYETSFQNFINNKFNGVIPTEMIEVRSEVIARVSGGGLLFPTRSRNEVVTFLELQPFFLGLLNDWLLEYYPEKSIQFMFQLVVDGDIDAWRFLSDSRQR